MKRKAREKKVTEDYMVCVCVCISHLSVLTGVSVVITEQTGIRHRRHHEKKDALK